MPAVEDGDDDAGALDAVEDDEAVVDVVAVVPDEALAFVPPKGARTPPAMSEQCDTSSPVASETVNCVIDERALSIRDSPAPRGCAVAASHTSSGDARSTEFSAQR